MRIHELSLFELLDVAEAALIEPLVHAGVPVDVVLDRVHQSMFDANADTWGEGPVAEATVRAMMSKVRQAPKRTPEELEEMNRRKAARYEKLRPGYLEGIATALRAYARNREGAE